MKLSMHLPNEEVGRQLAYEDCDRHANLFHGFFVGLFARVEYDEDRFKKQLELIASQLDLRHRRAIVELAHYCTGRGL